MFTLMLCWEDSKKPGGSATAYGHFATIPQQGTILTVIVPLRGDWAPGRRAKVLEVSQFSLDPEQSKSDPTPTHAMCDVEWLEN